MLIDKAKACLATHQNIVAAWLFGSQSRGTAHPGSDVDLAVWGEQPLTLEEHLSLQLELEDALGEPRVDLVDLRTVSPVLQFEALQGQRLLLRSPEQVACFSSLVGREYESAMALLKRGYRDRRDRGQESAS